MSTNDKEREFVEQVRRVLDQSAADVDGATRTRLASLRAAAQAPRHRAMSLWWPAAGLATAAGVGALAWTLWFNVPSTQGPPGLEHLDLLTAGDSLELYADLEFYRWLAEDQDAS